MDDQRIGAVIRAHRLRLGTTQSDLAIRAGVSPAMISRLEHSRIGATAIRTLRRVFAALDARIISCRAGRGPSWPGSSTSDMPS